MFLSNDQLQKTLQLINRAQRGKNKVNDDNDMCNEKTQLPGQKTPLRLSTLRLYTNFFCLINRDLDANTAVIQGLRLSFKCKSRRGGRFTTFYSRIDIIRDTSSLPDLPGSVLKTNFSKKPAIFFGRFLLKIAFSNNTKF